MKPVTPKMCGYIMGLSKGKPSGASVVNKSKPLYMKGHSCNSAGQSMPSAANGVLQNKEPVNEPPFIWLCKMINKR